MIYGAVKKVIVMSIKTLRIDRYMPTLKFLMRLISKFPSDLKMTKRKLTIATKDLKMTNTILETIGFPIG